MAKITKLDGDAGSGKTTAIEALEERLDKMDIRFTSFHGASTFRGVMQKIKPDGNLVYQTLLIDDCKPQLLADLQNALIRDDIHIYAAMA